MEGTINKTASGLMSLHCDKNQNQLSLEELQQQAREFNSKYNCGVIFTFAFVSPRSNPSAFMQCWRDKGFSMEELVNNKFLNYYRYKENILFPRFRLFVTNKIELKSFKTNPRRKVLKTWNIQSWEKSKC